MNARLMELRSLPRNELVGEIRRVTGNPNILLWEQVPMGSIWFATRAGPISAAGLGVNRGDVIGYLLEGSSPMGCAIGDLMNAVPRDEPPYPDPFRE